MIKTLLPYLKERSTWLGLVSLLTACGLTLTPEDAEVVVTLGLAIAGVIGMIFRDQAKTQVTAEKAVVETGTVGEQVVNAENAAIIEQRSTPELDKIVARAESQG